MIRAGLLVGIETLDAGDALAEAWNLSNSTVWGMSPFGGSASAPVWGRIDPRLFFRDNSGLSRVQAAFRTAYQLPQVNTVAVGTDEPAHLGELIASLASEADEQVVHEYRSLLRERLSDQPA